MTTYEHWKLDKLKNHRFNAEVFGELQSDADCSELVESVKREGILQPLIVVADGTILSGHRRKQAAAKSGLKEVPVIVRRDLTTQLQIDRVWFETNRNREMTVEQRARWFTKREAIEAEAAKLREQAALKKGTEVPAPVNLPEREKRGESAEIAAREVGMSRKTAKAAAAVVEVIDEAESKGDTETATKLRETLNTKSVSAAKREVDKLNGKPTKAEPTHCFKADKHVKAVGAIMRALDEVKAQHGAVQEYKTAMQAARDLHNAIESLDARLSK